RDELFLFFPFHITKYPNQSTVALYQSSVLFSTPALHVDQHLITTLATNMFLVLQPYLKSLPNLDNQLEPSHILVIFELLEFDHVSLIIVTHFSNNHF